MFCTLNSINPRSMDNLLANYLSVGDSINVHLLGESEFLKLVKSQEHLGLTITDNGHGRAFVKRIKSNDEKLENCIKPGDHIAKINGQSVVGMRHFEVAKALRQIPLNAEFELDIIKPINGNNKHILDEEQTGYDKDCHTKDLINHNYDENPLRSHINGNRNHQPQSLMLNPSTNYKNKPNPDDCTPAYDYLSLEDLADSSLPLDRILSRTIATNSSIKTKKNVTETLSSTNNQDIYKTIIKEINSILESFIGIDDHTLAIKIYRLARDHEESLQNFSNAIQSSELSVFNFGLDIKSHLWNCVNKAL